MKMSDSLKVQQTIKENVEEMELYFAGMQNWEADIKKKEMEIRREARFQSNMPLPRNAPNRGQAGDQPVADEDNGQPIKKKKSFRSQNIDEAFFEKELGNKYAQEQKWADAVTCYTKAIALDSTNAVYFANRALCYIKLEKWKLAEVDSTVAVQLDPSYVKAYKRRAFIRKEMNHYKGAREDYERIAALEPNCVEARQEIIDLDKRIKAKLGDKTKPFDYKNIFSSQPKKSDPPQKVAITEEEKKEEEKPRSLDSSHTLRAVQKPIHLRSKKPLQKIQIQQVESEAAALEYLDKQHSELKEEPTVEKIPEQVKVTKPLVNIQKIQKPLDPKMLEETPKSYVQFVTFWREFSNSRELRYDLLKRVYPELRVIFGSSLESNILTEMIMELAGDIFLQDPPLLFNVLKSLAAVDRFKSIVLFLTSEDEDRLKKCFEKLSEHFPENDVKALRTLYEM